MGTALGDVVAAFRRGNPPRRKDLLEGSWRDQVDEREPQAGEPAVGVGGDALEHALCGPAGWSFGVLGTPGPRDVVQAVHCEQPDPEHVEGHVPSGLK